MAPTNLEDLNLYEPTLDLYGARNRRKARLPYNKAVSTAVGLPAMRAINVSGYLLDAQKSSWLSWDWRTRNYLSRRNSKERPANEDLRWNAAASTRAESPVLLHQESTNSW